MEKYGREDRLEESRAASANMTFWTLIRRSLRFHARAHMGVVLGAAIGSAALIGALIVGDSVRGTLRERALARLGSAWFALSTGERQVLADLRDRLDPAVNPFLVSNSVQRSVVSSPSSALLLSGVASKRDGSTRANHVQVLGVDVLHWPRFAGWSGLSPTAEGLGMESRAHELDQQLAGLGSNALSRWSRGETVMVNETLARQLSVHQGDEIIVRLRKPTALGLDAALSPRDEDSVALRLEVGAVLPTSMLGDFSLSTGASPPANVFLTLGALGKLTGLAGRANLLLFGELDARSPLTWMGLKRGRLAGWLDSHASTREVPGGLGLPRPAPDSMVTHPARTIAPELRTPITEEQAMAQLNEQLKLAWKLEDAAISVQVLEQSPTITRGQHLQPEIEITSPRVFLDPQVPAAALQPRSGLLTNLSNGAQDSSNDLAASVFVTNGVRVLTYLANLIRAGERATPYSMVTAADGPYPHFGTLTNGSPDPQSPELRDDEILVSQWLANDLKVNPGDSVELSYFVPDSGSRLAERTNSFRVRGVLPPQGIWADRTLMPEFPGVAKAESTRDWDTGFPLIYKIREQDEAYWKTDRGTPKAFITLAAGQKMWANRFGSLTAIRYPVPANSRVDTYRDLVYRNLLANLDPARLGIRVEPVRRQALTAADQAQDFGQLFLGFSFFLVMAALVLMGLLFQFGLEQRAPEVGTLLALGFTPRQVRRLLLREGAALALAGGCFGVLGGVGYAKAMLWALATLWHEAVGSAPLEFHLTGLTLVVGLFASTAVGVLTLWVTLRKQAQQPIVRLLVGSAGQSDRAITGRPPRRSLARWVGIISGLGALGLCGWALAAGRQGEAETFFSAGSLCLIAGLAFTALWLRDLSPSLRPAAFTLGTLGLRGCSRRLNRSLATVALLVCGAFLITSIGVFRLDATKDASDRRSGTGGFALIGQTTLPVAQALNTVSGRERLGLDSAALTKVMVVEVRVHQGDEASCLNLNRAQQPRLLGIKPEVLSGRFTFSDAAKGFDARQGWEMLEHRGARATADPSEEPIPAIGDANAIQWALGKSLGDTLDYTDEAGRAFKVKLVGAVANSILQGGLLIDEAEFVKRFPGEGGYRMFLIDAPVKTAPEVSATLSRALQDAGMEITSTANRLNAFNAVQNTYLDTFQILGGLGLLLGSAGLGVVVLRNVLERRGELGLLSAVGFPPAVLQRLVLGEHAVLLVLGLGIGILAAAVAVLPSLLSAGGQAPWRSLAPTLAAGLLNGLVWAWLATRFALRGDLLSALRND